MTKIEKILCTILVVLSVVVIYNDCFAKDYIIQLGTGEQYRLDENDANKAVKALNEANVEDRVILNITSNGGLLDYAYRIIDAINVSNAEVITRCINACVSSSALVLMAGDDIRIVHGSTVIFHLPRVPGMGDKGVYTKEFVKKHPKLIEYRDLYLKYCYALKLDKFLLKDEWRRMLNGEDIELNNEQLKIRFARILK